MKEKLKNKKVIYTISGIIAICLIAIFFTYAYWYITRTQNSENLVSSRCLNIELNGSGDITLLEQYPISDEDGMKLVPYEFTVTNKCSTSIDYRIALEAIDVADRDELSASALKVALDENAALYSSYPEVDTTVDGAYMSKELIKATLGPASATSTEDEKTYELRIWIDADAPSSENNRVFKSKITATVGQALDPKVETGTLASDILDNYGGVNQIVALDASTGVFGTKITGNEAGIYRTQDDLGTSFYFRGSPTNNYVQFGSYAAGTTLKYFDNSTYTEKEITFEEDTPMYWRIVRINGDGTIRLVYDGFEKAENGTAKPTAQIGIGAFNNNDGDPKYVGYTYDDGTGTQVDSTIKGVLDAWYEDYLQQYEANIADSIFCNDKEIKDYKYIDEFYEPTTQANAKYTDYVYGPSVRFKAKSPSLECTRKEDRYTKDDTTNGNGYLKHPIGTITVDELLMAGYFGIRNDSVANSDKSNNYFYTGNWDPWTMSPVSTSVLGNYVFVFFSGLDNNSEGIYVSWQEQSYRPVINLEDDVTFEGDGSFETPYVITTE